MVHQSGSSTLREVDGVIMKMSVCREAKRFSVHPKNGNQLPNLLLDFSATSRSSTQTFTTGTWPLLTTVMVPHL